MYKKLLILTISVISSNCGAMVPNDTKPEKPEPKIPGFGYMASVDCALAYGGEAYATQNEALLDEIVMQEMERELVYGVEGETVEWR